MMKIFKKNYKVIVGIIIGIIISSIGVYASTTIAGSNITYSNSKSGLSSTNVQGAIDELYEKADIRKAGRFVAAYTYNETGTNKCITGEESTCKKTTCYKTKTANSCPAGTIIKYKVNDTDIVNFHVMFDNGSTMTMQSQRNTIYNTKWYDQAVDQEAGVNNSPLNVLTVLENATLSWSNVNNQTYNALNIGSRTSKVRMITTDEAEKLGCTYNNNSCPKWMYNYLKDSSRWELISDELSTLYYNTMDRNPNYAGATNAINYNGAISGDPMIVAKHAARAVVEVNK